MHLQRLSSTDLAAYIELIRLFEAVFEMQDFVLPDPARLAPHLHDPGFIALVARADGRIVGGLTAHVLPSYYHGSAELYLFDLAVDPGYQRRGIARALVRALQQHGREQGYAGVFVQADLEDTDAQAFYLATGGQPTAAIHYTYPLQDETDGAA
ncbi:MAG: hypothetical protein OHK0039_28970 [Bacteroidia bacterium]